MEYRHFDLLLQTSEPDFIQMSTAQAREVAVPGAPPGGDRNVVVAWRTHAERWERIDELVPRLLFSAHSSRQGGDVRPWIPTEKSDGRVS